MIINRIPAEIDKIKAAREAERHSLRLVHRIQEKKEAEHLNKYELWAHRNGVKLEEAI